MSTVSALIDLATCPAQLRIEVTSNTFKIVLPNRNTARVEDHPWDEAVPVLTAQMKKILNYIQEHGKITDEKIQSLLNLEKMRAFTHAK